MLSLKLVAVCLLVLMVVACGGQGDPPGTNPPPGGTPPPGSATDCAFAIGAGTESNPSRLTKTDRACDYYIPRSLTVSETLTIDPGVVIRLGDMAFIYVPSSANIVAVGTPEARITFEAERPVKGFANGIRLSTRSDSGLVNRIEYADFRNLGVYSALGPNPSAAIMGFQGAPLILKHTTVSGAISSSAVKLAGTELIEFADNSFFDNEGYGVTIDADQVDKLDAASDYLGEQAPNGLPYIGIVQSDLFRSATWQPRNAPYGIGGRVEVVGPGNTLTIEPGTTIVIGEGTTLQLYRGGLRAVGTPDAPIVFTGAKPEAGAWGRVSFFGSRSRENILEHVEVRYGGRDFSGWRAVIALELDSYLKMSHTTIADSAGAGVCVDWFLGAELEQGPGNSFENIPHGDILDDC